MENISFRFAEMGDSAKILSFITALAEYEKMSHEVVAAEQRLDEWTTCRVSGAGLGKPAE